MSNSRAQEVSLHTGANPGPGGWATPTQAGRTVPKCPSSHHACSHTGISLNEVGAPSNPCGICLAHRGPPGDPRCAGWNRSLINGSQETLTARPIANSERAETQRRLNDKNRDGGFWDQHEKAETQRRLNDENRDGGFWDQHGCGDSVGTRVGVGTLGAASPQKGPNSGSEGQDR